MHFLKEHYEKLALSLAVALLLIFGLLYFLAPSKDGQSPIPTTTPETFLISFRTLDPNSSTTEIETRNPHGLMPGDKIEFSRAGTASPNESFLVKTILFPEKGEEITVRRLDGTEVTGFFSRGQGELKMDAILAKLKITLEVDGSDVIISGEEIDRITGSRVARVARIASDSNSSLEDFQENFPLVVYQRRHHERALNQAPPWLPPPMGDDNVSYDLFTPPQIFFVDGKLSPKPPEAVEVLQPKEPFGVQLVSFKSVPYRFNLKSWSDDDPQLFDERNQRNEIVRIGKCYKPGKKETGYKIELTTEDDPDKTIKIHAFDVATVLDPKTGGTRQVGTLQLIDYTLHSRLVTIVSQQPSTADQWVIKVGSTMPESVGEMHNLTEISADKNENFFLGDREYRVLKIDPSKQSLLLEKLSDNSEENEQELIQLPSPSSPENK